jgi:Ser/Thr protein kinase RdoA (MazF antagonist)
VTSPSHATSQATDRDVFPTLYSTLVSEALVDRVLSQYDIPKITRCHFWHRGLSDVYLVNTTGGDYVLRVAHRHWRSLEDVIFELEFLEFLHDREVPVAYPLRTQDGRLAIEIQAPEGIRAASLFVYAPGEIPIGDLSTAQSWRLGTALAQVHRFSHDFQSTVRRDELTLEYLLDRSMETIAPFLTSNSDDRDYVYGVIADLRAHLNDLPTDRPYWTICWGDPHSGNAHFTAEGLITMFDFDQCGYGWRAFDLAKFLNVSLRTGISLKVREAFLAGYQSIESIESFEVDALQALTLTAHFWSWAIAVNAARIHNYSRLDETYFTRRVAQIKRLRSKDWQLF